MSGRKGKRIIAESDSEELPAPPAPARKARASSQKRATQDAEELEVLSAEEDGEEVELLDEGDDSEAEPVPAKNKRGKPKNRSHSQEGDPFAPPKSKKKSSEDHLEELNPRDYETLVGDIVRYILYRDATKQAIKRAEIGDKVLGEKFKDQKRKLLPGLIKRAQDKLRTVFGAELIEQKKKNKQGVVSASGVYFLRSCVDSHALAAKFAEQKEHTEEYGFLLTLISLIQMSDNHALSDEKLRELMRHCTPPNPLDELLAKFIKEGYLQRRKRKDAPGQDLHVGARALCELKNTSVPEFLATVFGETVDVNRAKELEFDEAEAIDDEEPEPASQVQGSQAPGQSQPAASQRASQRPRR